MRPSGRLRFQPSRPAPSRPHQVPFEHVENADTRSAEIAQNGALPIDPLENKIHPEPAFPVEGSISSVGSQAIVVDLSTEVLEAALRLMIEKREGKEKVRALRGDRR